jgi:hypothetical protein
VVLPFRRVSSRLERGILAVEHMTIQRMEHGLRDAVERLLGVRSAAVEAIRPGPAAEHLVERAARDRVVAGTAAGRDVR